MIVVSRMSYSPLRLLILRWGIPTVIAWILVLVLLAASACGGAGATATAETKGQVRGHVVEITEQGNNQVGTVRVRDEDGKVWTFISDTDLSFSASHLSLHQALGETVLISYETKGGRLAAVDITD